MKLIRIIASVLGVAMLFVSAAALLTPAPAAGLLTTPVQAALPASVSATVAADLPAPHTYPEKTIRNAGDSPIWVCQRVAFPFGHSTWKNCGKGSKYVYVPGGESARGSAICMTKSLKYKKQLKRKIRFVNVWRYNAPGTMTLKPKSKWTTKCTLWTSVPYFSTTAKVFYYKA